MCERQYCGGEGGSLNIQRDADDNKNNYAHKWCRAARKPLSVFKIAVCSLLFCGAVMPIVCFILYLAITTTNTNNNNTNTTVSLFSRFRSSRDAYLKPGSFFEKTLCYFFRKFETRLSTMAPDASSGALIDIDTWRQRSALAPTRRAACLFARPHCSLFAR